MCLCGLGACLGSCCATCLCQAVSGTSRIVAKYVYAVIFLVSVLLAWVVRDYAQNGLKHLQYFEVCTNNHTCVGALGVLRVSFGTFVFFALMFFTTIGTSSTEDCRDKWHSGAFSVKLLLWVALLFIPFFMPNSVFQIYGQIARVGSGAFLLIQIISLLNFVYEWNEMWLENEEKFRIPMVVVSVFCYLLSLCGIIVMYVYFAPRPTCSLNIFFITFTLIIIIITTAVSLHSKVNAGLLTSGVIGLYLVFLCYSSIMSEPRGYSCNKRERQNGHSDWVSIMSFLIAAFTIVVSVLSTGLDHKAFSMKDSDTAGDDEVPYSYGFFHFVFAMGAFYMAMLFLGWDLTKLRQAQFGMDGGWLSVWVKIVSQWLTALVYLWTMVVPFVLKDRTFS